MEDMEDKERRKADSAARDVRANDLLEELLSKQVREWSIGSRPTVEVLLRGEEWFEVGFQSFSSHGNEKVRSDKLETYKTETTVQLLMSLICQEWSLRESLGSKPTLEEYKTRFPSLTDELIVQWEIDRLFQEDSTGIFDLREIKSFDMSTSIAPASASRVRSITPQAERYEIRGEIGRGSIGIVYEAWDPRLKRIVALKRLRAGIDAAPDDRSRMQSEAEAIAKIRHPNIVQIFDVSRENGNPFLAMEICEGGSLAKRLAGTPLSPEMSAQLVVRIAAGVAAAHANGIIHRDLKPANILLESDSSWVPKIVDFGYAKILGSESSSTMTGSVIGTPSYMAPEQAFGDAKHVGATSDIYSLGAILYECLTGRPPFRGVTIAETLDQVRNQEPVSVSQLEPKVPLDLETIVHTCLRKEPSHRYPGANELIEDLQRFLDHRPILARRERWYESSWRLAKRYPMAASMASAIIGLLIMMTVGSLLFANYSYRMWATIEEEKIAAKLGQADALVGRAHGIRQSRQPGQRIESLNAIREAARIGREMDQPIEWFAKLRDEAIAALFLPDLHVADFREEPEMVHCADYSDDHISYAVIFAKGNVSLRRMEDHREIASIPRIDDIAVLGFIGNDLLLQFGNTHQFEMWNVGSLPPSLLWRKEEGVEFFNYAVSQDLRYLAVADSKHLSLVATKSGEILNSIPIRSHSSDLRILLHPTHPYVVLHGYGEPEMEIRNWTNGERIATYRCDVEQNGFSGAAWSPDGRRLILMTGNSALMIWFEFEPDSQELRLVKTQAPTPEGSGGGGPVVAFNRKGDRILVSGWDKSKTLLDSQSGLPIFSSIPSYSIASSFSRVDPMGSYFSFVRSMDSPTRFGMLEVNEAREIDRPFALDTMGVSFSDPLGRFLTTWKPNSIQFMDLVTRKSLIELKLDGLALVSIADGGGDSLLVNSLQGIFRWPYACVEIGNGQRLRLGIPQRVFIPGGTHNIAASQDGRTIASSCLNGLGTGEYAGAWIKTRLEPAGRKVLGFKTSEHCDVSLDGDHAVFALQGLAHVFHCKDEIKSILVHPNQSRVDFRSTENWLMAGNELWRTNDWEIVPQNQEGIAEDLSQDARQFARCLPAGVICLSDPATAKVFARIEGTEPRFSPQGNLLLKRSKLGFELCDLKAIRSGVLELRLPWDGPNYPNLNTLRPIKEIVLAPELHDITSAEQLYRLMDEQALKRAAENSKDGELAFAAAMTEIEARNYKPALEHLHRACRLMPESLTAKQWRAYLLAEMKDWSAAIADADWVLERIDEIDFAILRIEWLIQSDQHHQAIANCNRLLERSEPIVNRARGLRSLCYATIGDNDAAEEDRRTYLQLVGDSLRDLNSSAFYKVGKDISLRHPLLAQLIVDKMRLISESFDPMEQDTIGMVLYRNGRYQEALHVLEKNLEVNNAYYLEALCTTAMCYAKLADFEKAESFLQRSVQHEFSKDTSFSTIRDIRLLQRESQQLLDDVRVHVR